MKQPLYIDMKVYDDNLRIIYRQHKVKVSEARKIMNKFIKEKGL